MFFTAINDQLVNKDWTDREDRRSCEERRNSERHNNDNNSHEHYSTSFRHLKSVESRESTRSPCKETLSISKLAHSKIAAIDTTAAKPSVIPKPSTGTNTSAGVTTSLEMDELTEEEESEMMAKLMGFSSFSSTKGEHVIGADVSAADIVIVPNYRQYMHKKRALKE